MGRRKAAPIVPTPARVTSRKHARRVTTQYHSITRKMSSATTEAELAACREELSTIGGVAAYQQASALSTTLFSTSKWVARALRAVVTKSAAHKRAGRPVPRVLEIGAINTQLLDTPGLSVRAIDLHSSDPRIEQCDFLQLPHGGELDEATGAARAYDAVVCSMVLNCVPDARKRFDMLVGIRAQLRSGGRAFITLPRSCLAHSFTVNEASFRDCLAAVGLPLSERPDADSTPDSSKVAFYECVACLPDAAAAARYQKARHEMREAHRRGGHASKKKSAGAGFDIDLGGYLGLGVRVSRSHEPPGRGGRARREQLAARQEFLRQCEEDEGRAVAAGGSKASAPTSEPAGSAKGTHIPASTEWEAIGEELARLSEPQRSYSNWRWHGGEGAEWRLANEMDGPSAQAQSGWQWTEQGWSQSEPHPPAKAHEAQTHAGAHEAGRPAEARDPLRRRQTASGGCRKRSRRAPGLAARLSSTSGCWWRRRFLAY